MNTQYTLRRPDGTEITLIWEGLVNGYNNGRIMKEWQAKPLESSDWSSVGELLQLADQKTNTQPAALQKTWDRYWLLRGVFTFGIGVNWVTFVRLAIGPPLSQMFRNHTPRGSSDALYTSAFGYGIVMTLLIWLWIPIGIVGSAHVLRWCTGSWWKIVLNIVVWFHSHPTASGKAYPSS